MLYILNILYLIFFYYLSDCYIYHLYILFHIYFISTLYFYICYIYVYFAFLYFLLIIFEKRKLLSMYLFFKSYVLKVTVYQQFTQTKASYPRHDIYKIYISFLYIYLYATPSISGFSIYFLSIEIGPTKMLYVI